jgi:hypothetical protein
MSERTDLSHHILSTSSQLVGVCLTVISLIKALHIAQAGVLLDKFLAINALLFTISAAFSYASMRDEKSENLETYADRFFILGLVALGACAVLLSFEIL